MKKVGVKYPVYAIYSDTTGTPAYNNGGVIAKAMKIGIKWDKNDAKLYADDALDEVDQSITGGTESLAINELTHEVQSALLGHAINTDGELVINETDIAPYVGHGFYGKVKRNGAYKYRAVWLKKMQFGEPDDETDTQGDKVAFQTPTIEGKIMKDIAGNFKAEKVFDTEAEAKAWLNGKAGITPICTTPTADIVPGTYATAQTITLTAGVGESIYYTTNGLTPTSASTLYSTPITVSASEVIRAIAIKSGSSNSEVASFEYIITA